MVTSLVLFLYTSSPSEAPYSWFGACWCRSTMLWYRRSPPNPIYWNCRCIRLDSNYKVGVTYYPSFAGLPSNGSCTNVGRGRILSRIIKAHTITFSNWINQLKGLKNMILNCFTTCVRSPRSFQSACSIDHAGDALRPVFTLNIRLTWVISTRVACHIDWAQGTHQAEAYDTRLNMSLIETPFS